MQMEELRVDYNVLKKQFAPHKVKQMMEWHTTRAQELPNELRPKER